MQSFYHLQIDDERMIDLGQQALLQLDMIYLLQVNNLCLFQGFKRYWLAVEQGQINFTKCASSNHANKVEVGDLSIWVFYASAS